MKTQGNKTKLSAEEQSALLGTLKSRFEKNSNRHPGIEWASVESRLQSSPEKWWSLYQMEQTGGEPDVISYDENFGEFIFYDCSPESPKGHRSVCYDRAAQESRKKYPPANNAVDMAAEMGIELLSEQDYLELQKFGPFDLNVIDYLLKPISFGRFMQAVEKFFMLHSNGTTSSTTSEILLHNQGTSDECLYLREKNIIHKIPLHEIIYAESMGDNLTIYTSDREITSRITISAVEKLLPQQNFIRIHRSFIVSLKHITSFSPVSVFIGKKSFSIGTSYRDSVFEKLNLNGDWKAGNATK